MVDHTSLPRPKIGLDLYYDLRSAVCPTPTVRFRLAPIKCLVCTLDMGHPAPCWLLILTNRGPISPRIPLERYAFG